MIESIQSLLFGSKPSPSSSFIRVVGCLWIEDDMATVVRRALIAFQVPPLRLYFPPLLECVFSAW